MKIHSYGRALLCCCFFCGSLNSFAQVPEKKNNAQNFDDFFKQAQSSFNDFGKSSEKEFDDFRKRINQKYANYMKEAWKSFTSVAGEPIPEEQIEPVPPVISPTPVVPIKNKELTIENVTIPDLKERPQPLPFTPLESMPVIDDYEKFSFFGTDIKFHEIEKPTLKSVSEKGASAMWTTLSNEDYNNIVLECLKIRENYQLCDWAYLLMLKGLSESIYGKPCNEATILMAYIYCQSGYKMRLAKNEEQMIMLYATDHTIYEKNYFVLDDENFYPFSEKKCEQLQIFNKNFPKEQSMSLYIQSAPKLAFSSTDERELTSQRFPEINAKVSVNKNLLDFYETYPTSMLKVGFMTRWAMYANTPLSQEARNSLYPALQKQIEGLTEIEAANKLLNWVQTAFKYEYDDKVWGGDRAFFADETLHYEFCDCEDRSILLSRLMRDLLGVKVALIYYPGHLATAVCFKDPNIEGDFIKIDNQKFIVCDPTYINANVGCTMPNMDNGKAQVIIL